MTAARRRPSRSTRETIRKSAGCLGVRHALLDETALGGAGQLFLLGGFLAGGAGLAGLRIALALLQKTGAAPASFFSAALAAQSPAA